MRSSKSRSRSKPNRNRSVGNAVNRVFDSSGPEGKVRGTPQQIIDKYNQLARDAHLSNDRVAVENFQQHAEHYLRILAEALREQQERQQQQIQQQQNQQQQNQQQQVQQQQNQQRRQDEPGDRDGNQQPVKVDNQRPEPVEGNPQPSPVIEVQEANEPSGLVETPEEKAQTQRRPRRKKVEAAPVQAEAPSDNPNKDTAPPDAAE
ncbi:MAG: DUF4167 domain-containing protein [Boseongicola sp.]